MRCAGMLPCPMLPMADPGRRTNREYRLSCAEVCWAEGRPKSEARVRRSHCDSSRLQAWGAKPPWIKATDEAGFTHEEPKAERHACFGNYGSSLALRRAAVSNQNVPLLSGLSYQSDLMREPWTSPSVRMTAGCAIAPPPATSPCYVKSPATSSPQIAAVKPAFVVGAKRPPGTTTTCSRSSPASLMRESRTSTPLQHATVMGYLGNFRSRNWFTEKG
jgi:hypothetical protein